jgi:hypothetical protein
VTSSVQLSDESPIQLGDESSVQLSDESSVQLGHQAWLKVSRDIPTAAFAPVIQEQFVTQFASAFRIFALFLFLFWLVARICVNWYIAIFHLISVHFISVVL